MRRIYKVVEVIILGVIFFGLLAPISMLYRLIGCDPLNLKLHNAKTSYWVERNNIGFISKTYYSQFINK